MRIVAAALLGGVVAGCGGGSPKRASKACSATPVQEGVVRAGPFVGRISPGYDVLDGRFRLRVGRYRDVAAGLTQKIPWFVEPGARSDRSLVITGERLSPGPRTFRQTLGRTETVGGPGDSASEYVFPSIIAPPAEGCWRLRFKSGQTTGSLTVNVLE